jgi:hypothetical protein
MKPIRRKVLRIGRHVLGWLFIVLGILGLFLPILQGILFLCIGVLLLADDIPPFKRLIERIEHKWPRTRGPLEKARSWLGHKPQPEAEIESPLGEDQR